MAERGKDKAEETAAVEAAPEVAATAAPETENAEPVPSAEVLLDRARLIGVRATEATRLPTAFPTSDGDFQDTADYTMGHWGSYWQFKCRYCPWDTLEGPVAIETHTRSHRPVSPPPAPAPASPLVITNASGTITG